MHILCAMPLLKKREPAMLAFLRLEPSGLWDVPIIRLPRMVGTFVLAIERKPS